ncbi:heavy metal sensor histidine kinase [Bordetella hinzii]|uniref:Sensor protein n=2 Tax=Bordetella hinzii TaxID=103855 RepID=A0ABR4QY72_9BORD|nr:heavy metal sensor histidine kinase [Bordetella hinzii]AKQ61969.1 Sensor kinase CusS [Bordetella hinzii]KCB22874.1 heavy metal sensor kinase [Bordetella hinzii OH87 BAL007II]KCB42259.1 heavy metal sensor kinase [Bordetella hinzii 4161]KCB45675.1 heavy metal sensor kinase [Bordetella hinzii 5132]KCB47669.1 heavy metal sensor kinase [Bordetella hinzii 1277]
MKAPSLQLRLTLALGAIALLVSLVAGLTLYWALQREVRRQEVTEAAGKAELIAHLAGMQPGSLTELRANLDGMTAGHGNLSVWIEAGGRLIYGDAAPRVRRQAGHEIEIQTPEGAHLHGVQLPLDAHGLAGGRLTVAVGTGAGSQFLYAYGSALLLICALWVGLTVVLSAWAVRRTLAPMRRLSAQAASIGPDHPERRLPLAGIDREVQDLAAAFNRALERLQLAYQQMEGFNANVAHELRTPLATLINGAQLALSSPRSHAELRETLSSSLEELEDMKTLINDMLFLARADSGERAGDAAPVDLAQEARRVAEFFEPALERLHLDVQGQAEARANANLLRRALVNLVANAVRATPPGGTIRIVCETLPGGAARISVRNPGPPIAPADLPHIFERFYRADAGQRRRGEGHGLGLAIVRAIAIMHGGQVHASSGEHGTDIGLTLGPAGQAAR